MSVLSPPNVAGMGLVLGVLPRLASDNHALRVADRRLVGVHQEMNWNAFAVGLAVGIVFSFITLKIMGVIQ